MALAGLGALIGDAAREAIAPSTAALVRTGMLNVVAVGAAVGAVALISLIPSGADRALASLIATVLYLGGSALQLALMHGRSDEPKRRTSPRPAVCAATVPRAGVDSSGSWLGALASIAALAVGGVNRRSQ